MKYFTLIMMQLAAAAGFAQTKMDTKSVDLFSTDEPEKVEKQENSGPDFFTIVEDMPTYPGGDEAFFQFIASNTKYPPEAKKRGVTGVVYVSYIVNTQGNVQDVRVVRGVDPLLDAEAVRVVKKLKGFSPGMQRGKPVNVQFTLPVRFYLQSKK